MTSHQDATRRSALEFLRGADNALRVRDYRKAARLAAEAIHLTEQLVPPGETP